MSETHLERVGRVAVRVRKFFEEGYPDIPPAAIERIAALAADSMAAELTGETYAATDPVGDEAILYGAKCGHHFDRNCSSCVSALECTNREMDRLRERAMVAPEIYEAVVKGRQDFRNAYRELLPVLRAAEALSRLWRKNGQRVDVTEFWEAINTVDVAVCGGGAKPTYISERASEPLSDQGGI